MAAKKSGKAEAVRSGESPRVLPKEFTDRIWKPGQSGNPGGRTKKLTAPLEAFLLRKDKKGRQYAEVLIEAMVRRAISKSDTLLKEIFDRVEGHVPNDPAEAAQFGVKVIIMDVPRPIRDQKPKLPENNGND